MKILTAKNDEDFEQIHRDYGGSSMAAALFDRGYSEMSSRWSLWTHFKGLLDHQSSLEENQRVRIGKAVEPVHAAEVAIRTGWTLVDGALYHKTGADRAVVVDEDRRLCATVDRYIIEHEQGLGMLELKRRDYLQFVDNYTDEDAAIRDRIQLAHQFLLHPEVTWGVIGVWIGAFDFREYIYQREDLQELIDDVDREWREFWRVNIVDGVEPALTGKDIPAWLKAHDDALGVTEERLRLDDDSFDNLVETYQRSDGLAKEAKKTADDAKAKIVQRLDAHKFASSNRFDIKATYVRRKAQVITLEDVQKAGGELEVRKASTSVLLKIGDAVHAASGAPTKTAGTGRKETVKPSHDALRKAEEFQKPLGGE